jgi:hypothetical protein
MTKYKLITLSFLPWKQSFSASLLGRSVLLPFSWPTVAGYNGYCSFRPLMWTSRGNLDSFLTSSTSILPLLLRLCEPPRHKRHEDRPYVEVVPWNSLAFSMRENETSGDLRHCIHENSKFSAELSPHFTDEITPRSAFSSCQWQWKLFEKFNAPLNLFSQVQNKT